LNFEHRKKLNVLFLHSWNGGFSGGASSNSLLLHLTPFFPHLTATVLVMLLLWPTKYFVLWCNCSVPQFRT